MRVAVCEKKKDFFVSKIERKKVMQKTIELTSSGDSNRVLERARVGLYRVSRRSWGSRVTTSDSPSVTTKMEQKRGWIRAVIWIAWIGWWLEFLVVFVFVLFCLLLIFFVLHKLTLTFLLGCYFTVSSQFGMF